ncbi:MAG TPA: biotin/lipoyl-containing protein, partial [Nocardioides sp.]|nr:biotin/lipoyl-containing protein [Nocardioides sp.]
MATEVNLPALGESVTEGTVTRWLKSVGDSVAVDEPLLEVSTDKVDTEIPSPVAGTLLEIKAEEDDTVEVGAILAVIGEEGESSGDSGGDEDKPEPEQESEPEAEQESEPEEEPQAEEQSEPEPEPEQEQQEEEPAAEEKPAEEEKPADSGDGGGESTPVTLPALGESVTEGTVTRWLKSVGDDVAVDEPLLEVSTDKVDTEIPSPVAGTLLEIKVEEDETVEVGAELAVIGSGDAAPAEKEEPAEEEKPAASGGGGESTPVTLPALGESVTEGTVTRWLKSVGDDVAVDEPLLEVSTDKVDTEIPS